MEKELAKPLVGSLIYSLLGKVSGGWTGKPSDWSDIRKDCPKNSIALYAGHTADYSQYDNLGFTATMSASDLTTIGSPGPTIENGIASGFVQGQNRIEVAQVSNTMLNNFEFVTRANCNNSSLPLFYCYNTTFWLWINTTGKAFFRTNDLSSDIQISLPDSFNPNDYFNYKLKIKNNVVSFYFAEDNAEWQLVFEQEISTPTAFNRMLQIGNNQWWFTSGTVFPGSIDLNNTYIKVDGAYFLMPYGSQNGYNVFIDGVQYGSTYASGSTCSITWSTSGITTGDDITTPSTLKAHKIWIEPATSGNNITAFKCARVAASGQEQQGILWAHFNISNQIDLNHLFSTGSQPYANKALIATTAKNNKLKVSSLGYAFYGTDNLEYLPVLDGVNSTVPSYNAFLWSQTIKEITLTNMTCNDNTSMFSHCFNLEKVKGNAVLYAYVSMFQNCYSLTEIPSSVLFTSATNLTSFLTNSTKLEDTTLDIRGANSLNKIGCYGSSARFMKGFKGLRVSSSAPLNNATAPQINVSYTGMDRAALVQLFNDLPSVTAGQIISIVGATGSEDLTAADIAIAENKGWTITGGSVQLTNVSIVGSLVNNTGVISNFSSSNYAPTSITMNVNQDFKFDVRVNTGAIQYSSITYPILAYGAVIVLSLWNGRIRFGVGNNSSWSYTFGDGTQRFNQNTNYDIHLERTNGIYSCKHKEVGSDIWVDDFTYYNPNLIYTSDFSPVFGSYGANCPEWWLGSIDLKNTSFETNGITYKFVL